MEKIRYKIYSSYLKNKYKEKVYRIPINLPVTCPNRDGNLGKGGCTFCADVGTGFESLSNCMAVKDQLDKNIEYIGKKYKAKKFIAYFQNFTNTYLPISEFEAFIKDSIREDVVEISISTRPDAINKSYLEVLKEIKIREGIEITIELGLQSINHKTLKKINRGHTLAEFIEAVNLIKTYGFEVVAHMILNLPYDDEEDIIEGAKIISALKVDGVKLHSLYIVKNTVMGEDYLKGELDLKDVSDYVKKTALFLAYLNPEIVIHRIVGRAPKEDTLFCNYGISWWKIRDMIEEYMDEKEIVQGVYFNYLGGSALKKLNNL